MSRVHVLSPGERRHRLLAMALLLGTLGMIFALFHTLWWQPWHELHAKKNALLERRSRVAALLADGPRVAQALQQAEARAAQSPMLLPEATPEQAIAGLTQRVDRTVATIGENGQSCRVESRTPLPAANDATGAGLLRAAISVRLRCGNTQWLQLAHALENARPPMFIENLNISVAPMGPMTVAGPGSAILDISFILSGYLQPTLPSH